MFTDMELLFVGMESICQTILGLGKITHDSSVHRTHIAHRADLLGVGSAPLQFFVAEGPCRVFTDMELLFSRDGKQLLYHFGVGKDYS